MGFVDRSDQLLSYNKLGRFSKRWYVPLVNYLIDVTIHNSWVLYREEQRKKNREITQKEFRIILSEQLLSQGNRKKEREKTYAGWEGFHLPIKVAQSKKCSCGCNSNTPYRCLTCGCSLVASHFYEYHKNLQRVEDDENAQ